MKRVAAAFPGTCGELFQGTIDGVPCLVSCPVDRMARLQLTLGEGTGLDVPPAMSKTRRAIESVLEEHPFEGSIRIDRLRGLPEGKGFASSTADILAGLYAIAELSGTVLSPEQATRTALAVEPTDSIAWPGLALLDHREGRIMEFLGAPPPLAVLVVDEGGIVNTEEFNRRDCRDILTSLAPMHREAFSLLKEGIRKGDPEETGEAASLSAEACRLVLEKPLLDKCRTLARTLGGYGVCVAHSGTLYGILLPLPLLDAGEREAVLKAAMHALPEAAEIRLHTLVPGGARLERKV
jgi:L-threonine kinase